MAKSEIIFCASGLILFLLLKFAVLDRAERHQRLWQECQVLAALSERQKLISNASKLYELALKESKQLGTENARIAFSLADMGFLDFRQKAYKNALASFKSAGYILDSLESKTSFEFDPRLLAGESVRVELQKARCLELLNHPAQAQTAYLKTLQLFNRNCLYAGTPDLAAILRLKEAFCSYCQLSQNKISLSSIRNILSSFSWKEISARLSPEYAEEMKEAFAEMLMSGNYAESDKSKLLHEFSAKIDSGASARSLIDKID